MESTNVIVIPPHYEGTSFEEMARGISQCARQMPTKIDVIGQRKPMTNDMTGELLDDERYVDGQIKLISKITKRKMMTRVVFLDFFNPGLDVVRYSHLQKDLRCKYGAILHGGTFLKNDLYSSDWLTMFESAWAGVYDNIYVPSQHTIRHLPTAWKTKSQAIPFGMDSFKPAPRQEKKHDIIFPHRLNSDKGVDDFIEIAKAVPDLSIAIPIPQQPQFATANQYHEAIAALPNVQLLYGEDNEHHARTLAQSRIVLSCAKQELFGYSVMKSVLSDCVPVLPNGQCYPEFFPAEFLYEDAEQAAALIRKYVDSERTKGDTNSLMDVRERIREFTFKNILHDFFEDQ
jgi:glycosyltransferase involved in cell wall biosynthesis